jgi:hypothetical protein
MTRREFPALGFDPAPGDPAALTDAAARATAAATTFATAADELTPVQWTGDAADSFRATIGPLPADLGRADSAHRTAARTLADYAAGLHERQLRADTLEAEADGLRAREAAAAAEVNHLAGTRAPTGSAELAELSRRYAMARSRAESAGMDLARILGEAKLLAEDHHTAATAAARTIRAAADTAPYQKPGLLSRALDRTKRWTTTTLTSWPASRPSSRASPPCSACSRWCRACSSSLRSRSPPARWPLAVDAAIKLATGRGSWRSLALDTALTVMPWGRVYRTLKQIPEVDLALASYNRAIPNTVKGRLFRLGHNLPEGVTRAQVEEARALISAQAGHYGDDVIVQGSRASYRVNYKSDIDIGLRVSPEEFARIHHERFFGKVETAPEK